VSMKKWKFRIRHIIESIERAQSFIQGMTLDTFRNDEKTAYAIITCFANIGEAAKLVPEPIKDAHPEIPWAQMTRMRNILVHEYDRIDLEVVWRTVEEDLASLVPRLLHVLETHPESEK
jgi:uncharacterized protein with HEPN domain